MFGHISTVLAFMVVTERWTGTPIECT